MSNRILKGPESSSQKGEGSAYTIPGDDIPDGISSGDRVIAKIHGVITIDDNGGVIEVEKIEFEKVNARDDPLQSKIEEGLNIEVNITK